MSWGAVYEFRNGKVTNLSLSLNNNEWHAEQHGVALAAATDVIVSGAVGDNRKAFRVSLSGHGNPDHQPKSGWANDSVTISISQVE